MKTINIKHSFLMSGLVAIIFLAAGCLGQSSNTSPTQDVGRGTGDDLPPGLDAIIYLASDCSHCEDVDAFIKNNGIDKKINVTTTEAFKDKQTYDEFIARSKNCGMDITQIGTPMLWDGEKCYRGADKIFVYLGKFK